MEVLFGAGNFGAIQGPIIAMGSVVVNVMVWMILVVIGASIDMKDEIIIVEVLTSRQ